MDGWMKTFCCDHCGSLVFFENVKCVKCGHVLGFLPDILDLSALELHSPGVWRALARPVRGRLYRPCENGQEHDVCNWLVPENDREPLCASCRLNQTIPDLSVAGNLSRWFKMEQAKRRLIYTLLQLGFLQNQASTDRLTLQFSFLGETAGGSPILTGHSNGLITLNIAEADDVERENRRVSFHEPYRTLVGHFRHESGHYYWDELIANTPRLKRFRELFGDETADYAAALSSYYASGPSTDWPTRTVSAYASAHPWEDWAETWAHYLHIVDTVETAAGFGMILLPKHPAAGTMTAQPEEAVTVESSFDRILKNWIPLTYALNSLNRGMGLPDLYPFVLSTPAMQKLRFVHETVHEFRGPQAS
jgi:hypothetical protein